MTEKVAGLHVKMTADAIEFHNDLKRMERGLNRMGRQAQRTANRVKYAFNKLRRAAQVVASAFIFTAGIRQLGRLVSATAQAEDKVKLMQARFQQFARTGDAFTRIYNLAKNLGVSMDEAAGGMTRLLVATKDIGTAQEQLEQVYQNIVLLGRAGGTSTAEMVGGMRQLSQGLASGRLAGEELRSVLENLPLVAMEIAKQMGIGLGQLRAVAAEGKIVPEIVIAALSEIEIKMEDLPKTWAMQTENLRTEWDLFLADLSKAVDEAGLLRALTEAVQWVRFNMLGSFAGIATEDLESDLAKYKAALNTWEKVNKPTDRISTQKDNAWFPDQDLGPLEWQEPSWFDKLKDLKINITRYGGIRLGSQTGAEKAELLTNIRLLEEELRLRKEIEQQKNDAQDARDQLDAAKPGEIEGLKEFKLPEVYDWRAGLSEEKPDDEVAYYQKSYDAVKRLNGAIEDYHKNLQKEAEGIKDAVKEPLDIYNEQIERARLLLHKGLIDPETFAAYKEHLQEALDQTDSTFDAMAEISRQAARNIQDAFADFFMSVGEGFDEMVESFLNAIRRMLANQLAVQFMELTGLNKLFGRERGGPVDADKPYLVGERGPEIFVPSASGRIMPAHDSKSFAKYAVDIDNSVRQSVQPSLSEPIKAMQSGKVGEFFVNFDDNIRTVVSREVGLPQMASEDVSVNFDDAIRGMAKEAVGGTTDNTAEFFIDFDENIRDLARKAFRNPARGEVMPTLEARASGGPVQSGKPYVVGERGPELFIPGMAGQVIPNGAAVINNYSFQAGADVATIRREIIPMLERTKEATKAEWIMMRREGRV